MCRKPHEWADKDKDKERTNPMATEMKKKYELTDETKVLADGTVLHRIRATRNFPLADGTEVKLGDLGGWVKGENNL